MPLEKAPVIATAPLSLLAKPPSACPRGQERISGDPNRGGEEQPDLFGTRDLLMDEGNNPFTKTVHLHSPPVRYLPHPDSNFSHFPEPPP
jgi:hypothetical protein